MTKEKAVNHRWFLENRQENDVKMKCPCSIYARMQTVLCKFTEKKILQNIFYVYLLLFLCVVLFPSFDILFVLFFRLNYPKQTKCRLIYQFISLPQCFPLCLLFGESFASYKSLSDLHASYINILAWIFLITKFLFHVIFWWMIIGSPLPIH